MRKLNAYELIGASVLWCLDIAELTVADLRAFLDHIYFIAIRAMHDDFKDAAHVEYDAAIRKLAEAHGFAAFSKLYNGASVIHYGAQNMRTKRQGGAVSTIARRTGGFTHEGKRSCYRWNKESGCAKSEESCGFGHWCSKCGSKGHTRVKCSKD